MLYICISFLVAFIATLLILRYQHIHARFSHDHDLSGVQKYHSRPVPRIGGAAVFLAFVLGMLPSVWRDSDSLPMLFGLVLVALPAFVIGFAEDLTKGVSPRTRMLFAMISGGLGFYFLDAAVIRLDLWGVDWLLQFGVISFLVTMIVISGSVNAINIIDGYNGLAAVVSIMIFVGFGYVSFYLNDRLLLVTCVLMIGSIAGFFVWNFPRGLIFLGDGGAYFIGFMMGELAVLMLYRHSEVSAWFPLLLCIYPVFETLFSIYRKKILRGRSPSMPDGVHLHMLVYKRLVRWAVGRRSVVAHDTRANSRTAPYLWLLSSLGAIPAVLFWQYPLALQFFVLLFTLSYVMLYRWFVLFSLPAWVIRLTERLVGRR